MGEPLPPSAPWPAEDPPPGPPPGPPPPSPPPPGHGAICAYHGGRLAVTACSACDTAVCADCASPITQPGAPAGAAACPPCAASYGVPSSIPFENPAAGGWSGFWRTFGLVIGRPSALWKSVPSGPMGPAITFAYLAALPAAVANLGGVFCGAALQRMTPPSQTGIPALDQLMQQNTGPEAFVGQLTQLGVLYLCTPVIAALWAALHHIPVAIGGGRNGFGATFRLVCYCTPLSLFSMLCFPLSTLPAWIWHSIVMAGALRRVQGVSGGTAITAGLLPTLLFTLLCCVGFVLVAMFLAAAMQGIAG